MVKGTGNEHGRGVWGRLVWGYAADAPTSGPAGGRLPLYQRGARPAGVRVGEKQQNDGKERKPTVKIGAQVLAEPNDQTLEQALRQKGLLS
jgi:hypothetical protein